MDQETDVTKLWRTIKGIDGRAKREAENLILIVQAASHQVEPTVQYFKAGQTYFFKRDQGSDEGNQEETIGDGANIYHGPSYESNQKMQKIVRPLAPTNSASST